MKIRRFTNARIITRDRIIDGDLSVRDGLIQTIATETPRAEVEEIDLAGDFLLPGLIEIHTDNLEKNLQPRPGVLWPSVLAAALAHDVQIIGSGITTVLDALALGGLREGGLDRRILDDSVAAITQGQGLGLFKADHALHLRCEVGDARMADLLETYGPHPLVKLISVMDHTPGQRQWTNLDKWRLYHRDKRWTDEQAQQVRLERLELQAKYAAPNRARAIAFAKQRKLTLASHDDTTAADAQESAGDGILIAEFPTTLSAARAGHRLGMKTVMGSPNVVRGGSHSGNVSAIDLAHLGLLDGLSSDYVPVSLIHAAFLLSNKFDLPLPLTVAMVSANIAAMIGLDDRGEIAVGKRADLIRVKLVNDLPVVSNVWRAGQPVF